MHAAVAASLDRQVGDDPAERERIAARLAWHYEAGGLPLQAARALDEAGRQAMRVSAFREALELFDHGLALLAHVPRSKERTAVTRLLGDGPVGPGAQPGGPGQRRAAAGLARAKEASEHSRAKPP